MKSKLFFWSIAMLFCAPLFAQHPACGDIKLKVGLALDNQNVSDCDIPPCNQVVVPVFFKYFGTGNFTGFTAIEPQGHMTLNGPGKIVGVCKAFYDDSPNPLLINLVISQDGKSVTFSSSLTHYFEFAPDDQTWDFSLIIETDGAAPGSDFELVFDEFAYLIPSGGGGVSCNLTDNLYPLNNFNSFDECNDPNISLSFNIVNGDNYYQKKAVVKLETSTGDPVSIAKLEAGINYTDVYDNLEGNSIEVVFTSIFIQKFYIQDFNVDTETNYISLFGIPDQGTASINNNTELFEIIFTAPHHPDEKAEAEVIVDFVSIVNENVCCHGTSGESAEININENAPVGCSTNDYQYRLSSPTQIMEGCVYRYTVYLDYLGNGTPVNLAEANLKIITDDGTILLPSTGNRCATQITNNELIFNNCQNSPIVFPQGVTTVNLFEFYVTDVSGFLSEVAFKEASVKPATVLCVPTALPNTGSLDFSQNFQVFFAPKDLEDCEAIYAVKLKYTGNQSGFSSFYNPMVIVSIDDDDPNGNHLALTASSGHCQNCIQINGTTVTLDSPDPIPFNYSSGQSIELFEIKIKATDQNTTLKDLTIEEAKWKTSGIESYLCPPARQNSSNVNVAIEKELNSTVTGMVKNSCDLNTGIPNVKISISTVSGCVDCDSQNNLYSGQTNSSGSYTFSAAQCKGFGDLYAQPCQDGCNLLCGVTTFDLVLISKHILNVQLLNDPYKIIAADVNRSGTVTTFDLVGIRKVILRVEDEFPSGDCMRFIHSDYSFPDPANPFSGLSGHEGCKEVTNETAGWVGVKIGDVNCSCGNPIPTTTTTFITDNQSKSANETVTIDIKSSDFTDLIAYQMGIAFNPDYLEFVEFQEGDLAGITEEDNFGLTDVSAGKIRHLWFDDEGDEHSLESNEVVFSLVFTAKQAFSDLSSIFSFDDEVLQGVTWDKNDVANSAELDIEDANKPAFSGKKQFNQQIAVEKLSVTVVPNPFDHSTTFRIALPEKAHTTLEIFDALGAKIMDKQLQLDAGQHTLTLKEFANLPEGVYSFKVSAGGQSETGKLMKTK